MPRNRHLQNIRDEIYSKELEDTQEWTRAKVNECIISAVIMASRLSPDNSVLVNMLENWPNDSSVRYEWFYHLAMLPEINIPDNQQPTINSINNIQRVPACWLDRIDSYMDRTVLILHACGLSFNKIAEMFPKRRWTHNTLRRRHMQILKSLTYELNHTEELKWPVGTSLWNFA